MEIRKFIMLKDMDNRDKKSPNSFLITDIMLNSASEDLSTSLYSLFFNRFMLYYENSINQRLQ